MVALSISISIFKVPPSGGSLEIGNLALCGQNWATAGLTVPPSGGSLEIGNLTVCQLSHKLLQFPLRGDP